MAGAKRDALQHGAVNVAARMGEVQPDQRAFGRGIVDRRAFAGK